MASGACWYVRSAAPTPVLVETNVTKPMMRCGHAANAESDGKPHCVMCHGIRPGFDEIDEAPPSLVGRKAKCAYCKTTLDSSPTLAFFESTPLLPNDQFYCGCRGWD